MILWKQQYEDKGDIKVLKDSLKIKIPIHDMLRIQAYVDACDKEISGLGQVAVSAGIFVCNQPFILEQPVTGTSTDITEAAATFIYELAQKNQSPRPYKLWWHSHVDMTVFWSSTDEGTARGFNNEFMICMVLNKRGEFKTRLELFKPFRATIYDIPLEVIITPDEQMLNECKEDIKKKVHTPFHIGGIIDRGIKYFTGDPGVDYQPTVLSSAPKDDKPAAVEVPIQTPPAKPESTEKPAAKDTTNKPAAKTSAKDKQDGKK